MIQDESIFHKIVSPFYKSFFRFIYILIIPSIPVALLFLFPELIPFQLKTKQKIEVIFSIIAGCLFIVGWYRSNLAIYFFEQNRSFRKAHFESGQDIKFKCSYLPIIGFIFKNKDKE